MKKNESAEKESESKGIVRQLLAKWVVNETKEDYGIDFECKICDEKREVTGEEFSVQVKSSECFRFDEDSVKISLETDKLKFYKESIKPVLLALCDVNTKRVYWVIVQDFIEKLDEINPSWYGQKNVTIEVPLINVIEDLDKIRFPVKEFQKIIIKKSILNMSWSDGLDINRKNLSKLENFEGKIEKDLENLRLHTAHFYGLEGGLEKARKNLIIVYNKPEKDVETIRAIVGLVSMLSIIDKEENKEIFRLCSEGIELARKLNEKELESYLIIVRAQASQFMILEKISQILLSKEIQKQTGDKLFLSFYLDKELIKILILYNEIVKEIKNSIKEIENNPLLLGYSLSILLEMNTLAMMKMSVFMKEDVISSNSDNFIPIMEKIDELINFDDLKIYVNRSLANYYYWKKEPQKAMKYAEKALSICKSMDHKLMIDNLESIIELIKKRPNPYESKAKNFEDLTLKEVEELSRINLIHQGYNPEKEDYITKILFESVKDINIEDELKYCENLYIVQIGISHLGVSTATPVGRKFIWCEHAKTCLDGQHVKDTFELFKKYNCDNCRFRRPRSDAWICTAGFIKKRDSNLPPILKGALERMRS